MYVPLLAGTMPNCVEVGFRFGVSLRMTFTATRRFSLVSNAR
jgi:hypothetical protein